jgi:anaerobic selenocysteine-containing dehydrogenase
LLQIKEACSSVLEPYDKNRYNYHAQRVVMDQHLMQSSRDIFLAGARADNAHNFFVRQLRDMKISAATNGATLQQFNPMHNNVAGSWLPPMPGQ